MTEDTVTMRVADRSDGAAVLALLHQLQAESGTALFTGLSQLDTQQAEDDLAAWAQRDDGLVLLAVLGNQPLGILTITPQPGKPGTGELGVAVLKDYWHNGIGSMLVDEACYWFQNFSSLDHLCLEVFDRNRRAVAIYRRYGFQEVGHGQAADGDGQKLATILMNLDK